MRILYNGFIPARTVFYAFLFLCLAFPGAARAENPLFIVEGVEVDVTAKTSIEARDQAFAQAQQKAFALMTERMATGGGEAAPPEVSVISPMIKDFEITKEKLSAVRYIGVYTFRFNENAVRRYFTARGIQYSDVVKKPVLVIPFAESAGKPEVWGGTNYWLQAWKRAAVESVIVPLGDLDDVRDLPATDPMAYDSGKLAGLLTRYGSDTAVMAVAVTAEDWSVRAEGDAAAMTEPATVNVYVIGPGGAQFADQIQIVAEDYPSLAAGLDAGVAKVQSLAKSGLSGRAAAAAPVSVPAASATIGAQVAFGNLGEWARIRKALERAYGISAMSVRSLSPAGAQVVLSYAGTADQLALALLQDGISMEPVGSGYRIYLSAIQGGMPGQGQPSMPPVPGRPAYPVQGGGMMPQSGVTRF